MHEGYVGGRMLQTIKDAMMDGCSHNNAFTTPYTKTE
jgi:hypothetical protein